MMQRFSVLVFLVIFLYIGYSNQSLVCQECQVLADDFLNAAVENSTYTDIVNGLDYLCDIIDNKIEKELCKKEAPAIASFIFKEGIFVDHGYSGFSLCAILSICDQYCCQLPYRPEQVHISVGDDPTSTMVVQWVVGTKTNNQQVQYGLSPSNLNMVKVPEYSTYTAGGWHGSIYTATLDNLSPNTTYYYRVGDTELNEFSTHKYYFTTAPTSTTTTTRFAMYGDMGALDVSDATVFRLGELVHTETGKPVIDAILHAGDISYANGYQSIWDQYMRKIEYIAGYVPYMTAPGNHEVIFDFAAYKHRFAMPSGIAENSRSPFYYSFDYGAVHFIAFSFEQDFGVAPEMKPGGREYEWLRNDLEMANNNRDKQKWIVLYGHRPLYCSDLSFPCQFEAPRYRNDIEDLLYQYGVDIFVGAHVHNYESTYPVYKENVISKDNNGIYNNPGAPIYLVVGTGGNKEDYEYEKRVSATWTKTTLQGKVPIPWGFGVLEADSSALTWTYIEAQTNTIGDQFTILKN